MAKSFFVGSFDANWNHSKRPIFHHGSQIYRIINHVASLPALMTDNLVNNLIGPVIGDFSANPAALCPTIFHLTSVFAIYPFLLPNVAVAGLQVVSFILALLVLRETHPSMIHNSHHGLLLKVGKAIMRIFLGYREQSKKRFTRANMFRVKRIMATAMTWKL